MSTPDMDDHSNKWRLVEMGPDKGYALSGKIMLSAIVVLFAVVVFMVGIHLYAKWYLLRQRRRQLLERRRQRRASRSLQVLVMADGLTRPVVPGNSVTVNRGLDVTVLNSLPVSLYSPSKEQTPPLTECAVCLSEFEDKEIVRLLPKCNHSFHIECIDMWFHSHSNCPLCRSPAEKVKHKPAEKAISSESECSLPPPPVPPQPRLVDRRKGLELGVRIIDVPARNLPESEFCQSSPGNRLLTLKRILSMGLKSPATGCGSGMSQVAATELDLESGLSESSRRVVEAGT